MTTVTSPPGLEPTAPAEPAEAAPRRAPARPDAPGRPPRPLTPGKVAQLVGLWALILVICVVLVLYLVEPIFQQRTQDALLLHYQAEISKAHFTIGGLASGQADTSAPNLGSAVGVLEIPGLHLRQVVVEGVASSQTQSGPGHVPGTAALGQPGNSAVVGRRSTYGGPFGSLGDLHKGDRILVTTVQGQTVYRVGSVSHEGITTSVPTPSAYGTAAPALGSTANAQLNTSTQVVAGAKASRQVSTDALYGPTKANQLTLVTSASAWPANSSEAVVVVATMQTRPFVATAQNGRTSDQTGLTGDSGAWTGLVLALQALALTVVLAGFLYRRFGMRTAYLLTTPALILCVILISESASRLLPAWT